MAEPRIIIVGAGPSGVRAAEAVVKAGLRPIVIDEARRAGGQIYRRQPDNFTRPYKKLYGTEAARAKALHESFDALQGQIDYLPETLVWNVADQHVWTASGNAQQTLPYDALILCTGATDRLMPVKGWNLAGTYSLGGAQVALKSQAVSIGREVVFMGSGPLLYLVASQYVQAGAKVAAVLDTSASGARVRALPDLLALPSVLWNGVQLTRALAKAGVPVHHQITPVEVVGAADSGVTAVRYRTASGAEKMIACDAVAVGYQPPPRNPARRPCSLRIRLRPSHASLATAARRGRPRQCEGRLPRRGRRENPRRSLGRGERKTRRARRAFRSRPGCKRR